MALESLTSDSMELPFVLANKTPDDAELSQVGRSLLDEFFALCDMTPVQESGKSPYSEAGLDTWIEPTDLGTFRVLHNKTQDQKDPLISLRVAAEVGDEGLFVTVMQRLNWVQLSAIDFLDTIRLALKVGAHLAARDLATFGAQHYPYSHVLQKMSNLLGPPQVVKTNLPPVSSLKANREWMQAHADEYRGQWVALREGKLVANAPMARGLKDQVEDLEGLLITKVV